MVEIRISTQVNKLLVRTFWDHNYWRTLIYNEHFNLYKMYSVSHDLKLAGETHLEACQSILNYK